MDVQVRVIDCSIGGVALHITTITGALVTEGSVHFLSHILRRWPQVDMI